MPKFLPFSLRQQNFTSFLPTIISMACIIFKLACQTEAFVHGIQHQCRLLFGLIQALTHFQFDNVCFVAKKANAPHAHNVARFDSDSVRIGIDNYAPKTLSPNKDSFEDFQHFHDNLGGIGTSALPIKGTGTFVFLMEDNNGVVHKMGSIPNSLWVPGRKHALLAPQHWAQEAKDYLPKP